MKYFPDFCKIFEIFEKNLDFETFQYDFQLKFSKFPKFLKNFQNLGNISHFFTFRDDFFMDFENF